MSPPRPTITPLAFASLVWLSGCSAYSALDLPSHPAHAFPSRQSRRGVVVAARAYLSREAASRFFGEDLWRQGYFPVVLSLENRGADTVVLERSRARIRLETAVQAEGEALETRSLSPRAPAEVLESCRRSSGAAWLLAPLLVFPAVKAAESIEAFNLAQAADLASKSLPEYLRLEPGDSPLQGALFFRRPVEGNDLGEPLKSAELWIDLTIEGSWDGRSGTGPLPPETTTASPSADAPPSPDRGSGKVGEPVTYVLPLLRTDL